MGKEIRYFELNTGAKIPSVGLGTWQGDPGLVGNAVEMAVKILPLKSCCNTMFQGVFFTVLLMQHGYRHIDCAQLNGNEAEIGVALKKLFKDGMVKREDLTLRDLQLDYADLHLVSILMFHIQLTDLCFSTVNIHWPVRMKTGPKEFEQPDIPSTWRAMEVRYDSSKAWAIGVSNFSTKKLADLLEIALVPPAVNQVECHPMWQQKKLHEFCKSKGVHLSREDEYGGRELKILAKPFTVWRALTRMWELVARDLWIIFAAFSALIVGAFRDLYTTLVDGINILGTE
ncbi:hypothetical protein NL676_018449 [Syzygium grande]|nr:hypothetical protein NL676_018449 [Syzygium grande]